MEGNPGKPVICHSAIRRVDLAALNTAGEIAAICDRLTTYTLLRSGLVHRDPSRIADPWMRQAGPVLAQHRCGRAVPAAHRAVTAPPPAAAAGDPDVCPY
jgi:hypothetical protein